MLRIALPNKGRLAEDTRALLGDAGLEIRSAGERALTAALGDDFRALFVRAQDIPELVADGAADLGVTGWDLALESGRPVERLLDLGFGRCRLVVAVREESPAHALADLAPGTRIATAFPRIAAGFLAAQNVSAELVPVSGAAEVAPHLGIADVVIDLTSTGSTLRVNGLREMATVMESTACLLAPPLSQRRHPEAVVELTAALESVLRARGQRYLMANVPRSALAEVQKVLPGLNGPTVIDILDGGVHVAVHAVVSANAVYRTIAALKSLGAEGILVTRIERLMP
jgi:ATP phosphoribosyltransferase